MESIGHQIKDRETKLYTNKAEVHLSTMKEHTSIPKIDPVSRKIAQEMTKREIEKLGIKTKDPVKVQTLSSPKFQKSKRNSQKSLSKASESKSQAQQDNKAVKLSKVPKQGKEAKIEIIVTNDEPSSQTESNAKPLIVKPEDLATVQELISIKQLKRKKTLESLDHLNLMNAFREELHKDYPELGFDMSCEGSSFRTDELDDIESHSHEVMKEKLDKLELQVSPVPYLNTEESNREGPGGGFGQQGDLGGGSGNRNGNGGCLTGLKDDGIEMREGVIFPCELEEKGSDGKEKESGCDQRLGKGMATNIKKNKVLRTGKKVNKSLEKVEAQNSEILIKGQHSKVTLQIETPEISNEVQGSLKRSIKPIEIKESLSAISSKTRFECSPTHSKLISLLTEQASLKTSNLSFAKASFLHSPQDSVKASIPRCHLNLSDCKSTPVYYNIRLPQESKVKTLNGVGSVDSLRRLLLTEQPRPNTSTPKDQYSKNLLWSSQKEEKLREMRKSMDLQEQRKCKFSPTPHQKRSETQIFDSKSPIFSPKSTLETQSSILKLTSRPNESFSSYSCLSPVNSQIRYFEGCNMEKMVKISKPMVSYKQVNTLK